jgi:ketosteroid isomerase-like protein
MDIIQILKEDYQRFPVDQTYSIYAKDVFFKDPLNQFRGVERYKQMIGFIKNWFHEPKMDLHEISRLEDTIKTRWTL